MQFEGHEQAISPHDSPDPRKIGKLVTDTLMSQSASVPATEAPSTEGDSHRRPGYYLSPDDWPTDVPRDDLSIDDVYEVLDTFEGLYDIAMDGLSKVGSEAPRAKG